VFGPGHDSRRPYAKDAVHRQIILGEPACNPGREGTKAALHYAFPAVPPGGSVVLRLRLTEDAGLADPLAEVDGLMALRKAEADEFYAAIQPPGASPDERAIQRQAFAGLLWTKQNYLFDVNVWLNGDDPADPPPESRRWIRNEHWRHLHSMR